MTALLTALAAAAGADAHVEPSAAEHTMTVTIRGATAFLGALRRLAHDGRTPDEALHALRQAAGGWLWFVDDTADTLTLVIHPACPP